MLFYLRYLILYLISLVSVLKKEARVQMQRSTKKNCNKLVIGLAITFGCVGCQRTILVPSGSPIRLADDCRCHIYSLSENGEWIRSSNAVTISEGWYAVDPDFVEGEK